MSKPTILSKKIKEIRISKNMSQKRFGEKIGVSGKTISSYETGRSSPPLRVLENITGVYNVCLFVTKKEKKEDFRGKIEAIQHLLQEVISALDIKD